MKLKPKLKLLEIFCNVCGFPHVQKTVDGRAIEFSGTRDEESLKAFVRSENIDIIHRQKIHLRINHLAFRRHMFHP